MPEVFELIDLKEIQSAVDTSHFSSPLRYHLFTEIHSTNQYLKDLPLTKNIEICIAEQQTQGRGRLGRPWYSPFGENIYCSSRWPLNCPISALSALSLVIGLAIVQSLSDLGINDHLKIKWPNDIYWQGCKLAGILIETLSESRAYTPVIIGIGLNVNMHQEKSHIDQPCCSLYEITQTYWDRNSILSTLIMRLNHFVQRFCQHGFNHFLLEWQKYDYLQGRDILLNINGHQLWGKARGINASGQLVVENAAGIEACFSSGDVSLEARL